MNIKEFVFDFVAGRIQPADFLQKLKESAELCNWLQSIVPQGLTCYETKTVLDRFGVQELVSVEIPYNVKIVIKQSLKGIKYSKWGAYLNLHFAMSNLLQSAFPSENIEVSDQIRKRFVFGLDAVPEYMEGFEVSGFIDAVIDSLPQDLSDSKRKKLCRELLKEQFHIVGSKYPRWVQGGEWPLGSDGTPMKFLEQKRRRGKGYDTILYTEYIFEDTKTGSKRIIAQFT